MQVKKYLYVACLCLCFSIISCVNVKKATYFNNLSDTTLISQYPVPDIIIAPNDILGISVSSLNPEASALFNTASVSMSFAGPESNTNQAAGYLVNSEGYIQFPVLGSIKAAGLTEEELKATITKKLVEKKLLLDPIVIIRQLNFKVTVLGEVAHPTVINVPNEKISILEAIGMAGDLTIYAQRNNVLLIRQSEGNRQIRRLNLNNNAILNSPYFYLKNNDVVYVQPNKTKIASTGRSQIILPIVFSGLSLVLVALSYWKR